MNKEIFWIASFPKSGNTLVRSIISSLFFSDDGNFTFNKLANIDQFERTDRIEKNKKIFGNDINNLNNTPILYKYLSELQTKKALGLKEDFMFLKTHCGLFEIGGKPFTSKNHTRGIIYIIRDPRDVCISWSKHLNISLDKSIENMMNEFAVLPWTEPNPKKNIFNERNRPRSYYSSWENHVLSWTLNDWDIPIKIIKFEDLVYDKINIIKDIVLFFEKNFQFKFKNIDEKIDNIFYSTNFEKLKADELKGGFFESTGNSNFFSVGKKNQWKNKLNNEQIMKIEKKFKKVMKKFNYKLAVEIS